MGQFSWLDCVTGKPILDGVAKTSYVLVPKEFGGGHIAERCYNGYGNFGGYDIYELVLDWNKEYIPEYVKLMKAGKWEGSLSDVKDLMAYYKGRPVDSEIRDLGITLACYDEDNERLQYPIKITYDPDAVYEDCGPSDGDPNQGWGGPEPADMFYGISATLPAGVKFNKSAITKLVKKAFGTEVTEFSYLNIRDAKELRIDEGFDDPYDEEAIEYYPDDVFSITVNCTLADSDTDQYVTLKIYDVFEDAGYTIDDVYYEQN